MITKQKLPRRNGPKLQRARRKAIQAQGGRCIYCNQPMWDGTPDAFCKAFGLSETKARWFRCTAEHLVARQDGGDDKADNIAAVCLFCNSRRHLTRKPLDPDRYAAWVRKQLAAGAWPRLRH